MKPSRLFHRARPASIRVAMLAVTATAACVVASACSGNSATSSSSDASADDTGSGGDSGSGGEDSSPVADTATGMDGVSAGDSGGDGAGSTDGGVACVTDAGCYSCPPTNTTQFENACTTGESCVRYDNATNLPFWNGQYPLPALPP